MRPAFSIRLTFALFVAAEAAVLYVAVRWLGGWPVFWLVLATGFLGGWFIRKEGLRAWRAVGDAVRAGQAPDRDRAVSGNVVSGAFLLMLPGFLTDVLGALLLIPSTRRLAKAALMRVMPPVIPRMDQQRPGRPSGGAVIEGEVIETDDRRDAAP